MSNGPVGGPSPDTPSIALSDLLELAVEAFDAWQHGETEAARNAASAAARAATAAVERLDVALNPRAARRQPDPGP